ncbi:P-loop containing nucleoside triphosphate hydrolase protein [Xylaria curta]|nr:P-loop containing nucleoside triphosphate hydrolase protein [Xylaria curta]
MVVSFNTEVLNGLCSKDQLELLDTVDQLRLQGIDHYISLPQIIVCGDQSSGKSSVLEAISGVPFPVKGNLCTRFPTELILRRSPRTDVTVSIIPHRLHSRSEKESLSTFHETLDGFDGLADLIESAKIAMGISIQGKGFSKDLLRIEISGPHHPHLTIVDLPGLIHSETKQQSASDVELVRDVVQAYMKQPRSIILAVVSAKNDAANQIVLKLARSTDPGGKRTMGVITKPDTLVEGSGTEIMYVSLAENKEVEFDLGWHVLRNLDSEKVDKSSLLHRRNEEEEAFFSQGVWSQLPSSMLGVKTLRTRLSEVLLRQIATELPSLIMEIDGKRRDCSHLLSQLGEPRATVREQKMYLISVSQKFQSLIYDVNNGTYNNNSFFERAETDIGYEQRLRAVIQNLNRDFAKLMTQSGHARNILSSNEEATHRNAVTRDKFIQEVQELMRRTRGRELPGRFGSLIITDLFLEQSKPWRAIVTSHVDSCWIATKRCLKLAVTSVAGRPVGLRLLQRVIDPALDDLKDEITSKANELIDSQVLCHPVTYNEQYLEALHRINDQGRREFCSNIVRSFFRSQTTTSVYLSGQYNLESLIDQLSRRKEPDDERFAASEAVDCMEAYYNVALRRIIDDVSIEVIERKLMASLPSILSPTVVFDMSDDLVTAIAGESNESRAKRTKLANQVEVLQQGFDTCKRFADVRLDDFIPPIEDIDEEMEEIKNAEDAMSVEFEPADSEQILEIPDSEEERQKKTKKNKKKKMRKSAVASGLKSPEVETPVEAEPDEAQPAAVWY